MAITDIKPYNILVDYGINGSRFSKVQLADCGDSIRAKDVGDFTKHKIGADFFRSPEALLMQRWDTPTDIWSFGATVSLELISVCCLLTIYLAHKPLPAERPI